MSLHRLALGGDEQKKGETMQAHSRAGGEGYATAAIAITDMQGRLQAWWGGCEQLTGFSAAEMLGKPLPVESEQLQSYIGDVVQRDLQGHSIRTRCERKDGSSEEVVISGFLMRDETGTARQVIHALTVPASTETEGEQSRRLAAIGQLASGIAHEFNNLLFAIKCQMDAAMMVDTIEAYRELGRAVEQCVRRGVAISSELLQFGQASVSHQTRASNPHQAGAGGDGG